jgi:hypothetical protein
MSELRREIRFEPGYDRVEETKGKYGRASMRMWFLLHGDDGSVQFVMHTGWLPTHIITSEWGDRVDVRVPLPCLDGIHPIPSEPMASDLGRHWRTPLYEGEYERSECDVIDGGCYYDGSGLGAESIMAAFFQRGDVAIWEALGGYYGYCKEQADAFAATRYPKDSTASGRTGRDES